MWGGFLDRQVDWNMNTLLKLSTSLGFVEEQGDGIHTPNVPEGLAIGWRSYFPLGTKRITYNGTIPDPTGGP